MKMAEKELTIEIWWSGEDYEVNLKEDGEDVKFRAPTTDEELHEAIDELLPSIKEKP